MEENRMFTLVVIGDNPEEQVKPFDSNIKVEPYIMFDYSLREVYKLIYISQLKMEMNLESISDETRELLGEMIKSVEMMNTEDFYSFYTSSYEVDKETGNVMTDKNPKGYYDFCHLASEGGAMPLYTTDGSMCFSELKGNIDWNKTHLGEKKLYERVWDICMDGEEPQNENEINVKKNLFGSTKYFEYFGDVESYSNYSSAFWGYAILRNGEWLECDESVDQKDWVMTFYDKFIKDLDDNTRITLFECFRK